MSDTYKLDKKEVKIEDVKSWYNNAWSTGQKLSREVNSYKVYVNIMKKNGVMRLLDVGCGDGKLCKLAAQSGIGVCGIDISEVAIEKAKKNVPAGFFRSCSIEEVKRSCYYDCIAAIGSLEHTPDIPATLKKIKELGNKITCYIFVVPNQDFFVWKLKQPGTHQQEIGETLYTYNRWKAVFKDSGYTIKRVTKDKGRGKFMRFIMTFVPLKYTYQFIFECRAVKSCPKTTVN